MTETEVVRELAERLDLPKKQVATVFDELLSLATQEAKNGFKVPGFGALKLSDRNVAMATHQLNLPDVVQARIGRNPGTGEPVTIPAKRVCKFRLAKSLKDAVLGKP